ncbi:hypothetical protein HPB51_020308 [Rhipicephalus microplus]|uniref:Uncharacterized protein n=1 Tax=Rhipicephalus microplus TaxID=6941 RepID=A0A9J6DCD6_RHIMP|nr:hypothetical protein HPB51_020308 [Rhipicephalus microplus]
MLNRSRCTKPLWHKNAHQVDSQRERRFIGEHRLWWTVFPTAGPLRAPGTSDKALGLDAPKEEPFKRSLSFGIGGSSGDDKNTYQLMFLFGKGKKGRSQEPGRKLMSDAMLTKTEHDEETIAAVLRAPGRCFQQQCVPHDDGHSPSNAVGGQDLPQLSLFEQWEPQCKLSAPQYAAKEEPINWCWSCHIGGGGSGFKT